MMGGLAYMTGPPGQPLRAGASVIDVMGGTFGVVAILAALLERVTTGKGKLIHSGLYETCVFLVGQHMAQYAVTGAAANLCLSEFLPGLFMIFLKLRIMRKFSSGL